MTSAPGPRTSHSNKLLFYMGPAPRNSSENTTKHGLTPPPTHAHNSSTHSNLTFSNTNPQPLSGPQTLSPPPLPVPSLMIHSVRCVTAPLTRKKRFSVTYVTQAGIWTACSPTSLPSLPGYGNAFCVPLLPPHPAVPYDTSASPLPSLTLTLTKHHLGKKKKRKKGKKTHPSPVQRTTFNPPAMEAEPIFQEERTLVPDHPRSRPQSHPLSLS